MRHLKVMKMFITLPVTNATGEHSFSKLALVKKQAICHGPGVSLSSNSNVSRNWILLTL